MPGRSQVTLTQIHRELMPSGLQGHLHSCVYTQHIKQVEGAYETASKVDPCFATCTLLHMQAHIPLHTHTLHICPCTRPSTYPRTHTPLHTHLHTHLHTTLLQHCQHTHLHRHPCTHTYLHTRLHTHTLTHTPLHTHLHTYLTHIDK